MQPRRMAQMLLLVDEDVASPWGVFGSAGRSDFVVVWMVLSIIVAQGRMVEGSNSELCVVDPN